MHYSHHSFTVILKYKIKWDCNQHDTPKGILPVEKAPMTRSEADLFSLEATKNQPIQIDNKTVSD